MTVHIHVAAGDGHLGPQNPIWVPWINCTDVDHAEQLAAHRHIRDRGGVGERESPYHFTIWSHTDATPKHPNGKPMCVHAVTLSAHYNQRGEIAA